MLSWEIFPRLAVLSITLSNLWGDLSISIEVSQYLTASAFLCLLLLGMMVTCMAAVPGLCLHLFPLQTFFFKCRISYVCDMSSLLHIILGLWAAYLVIQAGNSHGPECLLDLTVQLSTYVSSFSGKARRGYPFTWTIRNLTAWNLRKSWQQYSYSEDLMAFWF